MDIIFARAECLFSAWRHFDPVATALGSDTLFLTYLPGSHGHGHFMTALPQGIEKALTKKSRALISKRSEQTFPNQRR
jgi:hypothetical protein